MSNQLEELENKLKMVEASKNTYYDLFIKERKENKQYRVALEYYADELNYLEEDFGSPWFPDYRSEIQDDGGEVAQKALGVDSDE